MTPPASAHTNPSGPTIVDRGGDGRNEGTSDNSTRSVGEMKVIRSFRTLVELLPGLELERGVYYVSEPLLASNLQGFASAAKRVEDLTLTDAGNNGSYRTISSDTIVRLAVQDARIGGFFSSLQHLRLIDANIELDYLWLCLAPSIRTLEMRGLKRDSQTTVSTFLKELALKSPHLEALILGPCSLPSFITLTDVLKFVYLRRLETCHFSESIKFTDLKAISVLPHLEAFVIETSRNDYVPRSSSEVLSHEKHALPFPKLVHLAIQSNAILICDLVFHLFPKAVEELSLTLIHDRYARHSLKWLIFNMSHWSNTFKKAMSLNPEIPAAQTGGLGRNYPEVDIPFHTFITKRGQKRICHGLYEPDDSYICNDCSLLKRRRIINEARDWRKKHDVAALCFSSVLNKISTQAAHISVLRISCMQVMETDGTTVLHCPATIPHNTLLRLLYSTTLVKLEIEKWTLKSIKWIFLELSKLPKRQLKFESIYLPLESSFNDGVELTTLSSITQLYPRLLSFHSRLSVSADKSCDLNTLTETNALLSVHGLKELRVCGSLELGHAAVDKEAEITSYIYLLFPKLEKFLCLKENLDGPCIWERVERMLKVCHNIRHIMMELKK